VFWNDQWFEDVVRYTRSLGIKNSEWWSAMLPALENGSPAVRQFLDEFVGETNGELFSTREDCVAFYTQDDNFERLKRGEIGDNLMYRYRAIASFFLWEEICNCALDATRQLLVDRGLDRKVPDFDTFWTDFSTYTRDKHASGSQTELLLAPVQADMHYDIIGWLAQDTLGCPSEFRLAEPQSFVFRLTEESRRELSAALSVWTLHIKGLTKLVTRINVGWQVRECVPDNVEATADA
jgi:hypothetical protein